MLHYEELSMARYMCDTLTWKGPCLFIRAKPFLSLEMVLRKDYGHKGSAAENIKEPGDKTKWLAANHK
jgi:hypothetical protein